MTRASARVYACVRARKDRAHDPNIHLPTTRTVYTLVQGTQKRPTDVTLTRVESIHLHSHLNHFRDTMNQTQQALTAPCRKLPSGPVRTRLSAMQGHGALLWANAGGTTCQVLLRQGDDRREQTGCTGAKAGGPRGHARGRGLHGRCAGWGGWSPIARDRPPVRAWAVAGHRRRRLASCLVCQ